MTTKRLFLLDSYALIFRAYYALIKMPRITQAGFNTSAIFGFVNTLEEVLRKERPTHLAACFDPQGPTFRSEAYEDYKGEREATPEDIKLSIPVIKEILKAYNIPILEVAGFEADDVIGTMAKKASEEGFTTYMMTPDKDFGQLVGPNVLQYKPSYRGQDFELRGETEICERYGIETPKQVIDLLALMGDKVDNIPGCPGVGEVTATKLIRQFHSVENLLERTSELKGALKKKVEENAEQIRFSKFLATIRTDAPLEATPESLAVKEADREKLFAIFDSLEFRTLKQRVRARMDEIEEGRGKSEESGGKRGSVIQRSLFDEFDTEEPVMEEVQGAPAPDMKITEVATAEALEAMNRELLPLKEVGLVMMSYGENDMEAEWSGTGIATSDGRCWFIPRSFEEGKRAVADLMARGDIRKVTPSAKRDYVLAARLRGDGAKAFENYYDVAIAHYLLQPDMRHGIETLAQQYLSTELPPQPAPVKSRSNPTGALPSPASEREWCVHAAMAALRLREPLDAQIRELKMEELLDGMELPLAEVLAEMELTGVRIDVDALNAAAEGMQERIAGVEKEIYGIAGENFNVGSPSKVGEILFDKLQLDPKAKKTKTGQYSTSEEILGKLIGKSPIVELILKYRRLKKLLNTYLLTLPEDINRATGKVHTNYNQTVTATGRISSSCPNLQNIPVRNEEGREIRKAFIADPGHLFLSADYSQIELRLVADFAKDETMIEAFREDRDIHAITAAKIYHKPVEEVTADERRHAKTANFGILYGISAFGLASRLGIPRKEAAELIENYFKTFPTIKKYISDSVEEARERKYAETRLGRRRWLNDINSRNPVVRGVAERNAINAPIQGTAADIIKLAMVRIAAEFRKKGLKSRMIMQVHDELNFDVLPEELAEVQETVTREMGGAWSGSVELSASSGVATNWLDAH